MFGTVGQVDVNVKIETKYIVLIGVSLFVAMLGALIISKQV